MGVRSTPSLPIGPLGTGIRESAMFLGSGTRVLGVVLVEGKIRKSSNDRTKSSPDALVEGKKNEKTLSAAHRHRSPPPKFGKLFSFL